MRRTRDLFKYLLVAIPVIALAIAIQWKIRNSKPINHDHEISAVKPSHFKSSEKSESKVAEKKTRKTAAAEEHDADAVVAMHDTDDTEIAADAHRMLNLAATPVRGTAALNSGGTCTAVEFRGDG